MSNPSLSCSRNRVFTVGRTNDFWKIIDLGWTRRKGNERRTWFVEVAQVEADGETRVNGVVHTWTRKKFNRYFDRFVSKEELAQEPTPVEEPTPVSKKIKTQKNKNPSKSQNKQAH